MAAPTLYRAAGDEFSTTLSSSCTAGDLTMSLNSATGLNSSGGMLIIDEGVANKEEVIAYSSVAGTTLTIPSGGRGLSGTTAYAHSSGATVTDIIVADHVNKLITSFTAEHSEAGAHTSTVVTNLKATSAEVATGTNDTKIVTPLASAILQDAGFYRQSIINGGMIVAQRGDGTLSTSAVYGKVDRLYGIAGGTVGAGTITQSTSASVGTSGYAFKLSGVTLTGSGLAKMGYRMEAKDAAKFKNQTASISVKVYHDVGSAKTYTIYVNKADVADTFSAVTAIGNNGGTSVNSATATTITYENISLGTCSNGIEIIVECNCGAITTKNFEFAELQMNLGASVLSFQPKSYGDELLACQRYCYVPDTTATNSEIAIGNTYSTTQMVGAFKLPTRMRIAPSFSPAVTVGDWQATNYVGNSTATVLTVSTQTTTDQVVLALTGTGTPFTAGSVFHITSTAANKTMVLSAEL